MKASRKELRSTGLVVGIAFALFATAQLLFHGRVPRPVVLGLYGFGGLLVLLGLVAPPILRPFHFVWMKFAEALGWVMNRVILGVLFYVFFTLMGLIMRLAGRDALGKDFQRRRESYWRLREEPPAPPERYERQF